MPALHDTPMALPSAASARTLTHRRSIEIEVFARGDGIWEVDARLADVRSRDTLLASGLLPAGQPIHDMLLRLVIDERFNIVEAGSETSAMPYPGSCNDHDDAYGRMVGLNLMHHFRKDVKERLGGVLGCTHITELTQNLPTAVVQAFAGIVIDTRGEGKDGKKPFQIDRCHALRSDGDVVRAHYPRWYRQHGVSRSEDTAARTEAARASPSHRQESPP